MNGSLIESERPLFVVLYSLLPLCGFFGSSGLKPGAWKDLVGIVDQLLEQLDDFKRLSLVPVELLNSLTVLAPKVSVIVALGLEWVRLHKLLLGSGLLLARDLV